MTDTTDRLRAAALLTDREQMLMDVFAEMLGRQLNQVTENSRRVQHVTVSARDLPPTTVVNEVRVPSVEVVNNVHPAPVPQTLVTNEVRPADVPVTVTVDTGPLAAAIDRQTAALEKIGAALAAQAALFVRTAEGQAALAELLAQLVAGLAEQPAPAFSPQITLPELKVEVLPAPVVLPPAVKAAPPPAAGPKEMTIRHSDGSESTITVR